jgi:hypothetical protein
MSIKKLNELAFEALKLKHPNCPIHCLPFKKYSDKNANELEKSICAYINLTGGQAERVKNSGRKIGGEKQVEDIIGIRRTIGSSIYIKGTGTLGASDISAIYKGRSLKIEVKFGKDRQSKHQKEYQKSVELVGGSYFIAKTFNDFFEKYTTVINSFK